MHQLFILAKADKLYEFYSEFEYNYYKFIWLYIFLEINFIAKNQEFFSRHMGITTLWRDIDHCIQEANKKTVTMGLLINGKKKYLLFYK